MAERKRRVVWTCPKCNGMHSWRWAYWDVCDGPITMQCEDCGEGTKGRMVVDKAGDATVEFPEEVARG